MPPPQLLTDAATAALTLFMTATATCAFVSVFAPTSERRRDARASLRILLRRHAPPTDARDMDKRTETPPSEDAAGEP